MFKIKVDGKTFEVESTDSGFLVNGETITWDLVTLSKDHFSILYAGRSFNAEILDIDTSRKSLSLKVNGHQMTIEVKDKIDLLLEKMGITNKTGNNIQHVKAPMPGLIVNIKVKIGDQVNVDEPLIVLEAMKMENTIKSPREGIVKSILVSKGQSVEKGQLLIEY